MQTWAYWGTDKFVFYETPIKSRKLASWTKENEILNFGRKYHQKRFFRLKTHQEPFGGRAPLGELTALLRPSSWIKGVGPARKGRGGPGGGGKEERGKKKRGEGKVRKRRRRELARGVFRGLAPGHLKPL